MPFVRAQCTNCGAHLEVDSSNEAAICPFCHTPYIVEKAINLFQTNIVANGATINVTGILDADSMFENWLITKNPKLMEDFKYYYATDDRCTYMDRRQAQLSGNMNCCRPEEEVYRYICKMKKLAMTFLTGPRYEKYLNQELLIFEKLWSDCCEFHKRKKEEDEELQRAREQRAREAEEKRELESQKKADEFAKLFLWGAFIFFVIVILVNS